MQNCKYLYYKWVCTFYITFTSYLQHVHNDTYAPNVTLLAVVIGTDNFRGCQPSRKNNINNRKKKKKPFKCLNTKNEECAVVV